MRAGVEVSILIRTRKLHLCPSVSIANLEKLIHNNVIHFIDGDERLNDDYHTKFLTSKNTPNSA